MADIKVRIGQENAIKVISSISGSSNATNVVGGIASVSQLTVSGLSSLNQLTVSGIATFAQLSASQLSASQLSVSQLSVSQLSVSGISSFNGDVYINGNFFIAEINGGTY